jgi:beta-galactosidase
VCAAVLALVLGVAFAGGPALANERSEIAFDEEWRFQRADQRGAQAPGLDDTAWQEVRLPHTWNVEDGAIGGEYWRGAAWYRRHFTSPPLSGQRLFVRFGAANQVADVYLNSRKLCSHRGGYTAFVCDLTPALATTGENVLAVRVSNAPDPSVAPLKADFTFFGGLYRGASMTVTGPVHIGLGPLGDSGVTIEPTAVSAARAQARVRVEVANDGAVRLPVGAQVTWFDATHRAVATGRAQRPVAAHTRTTLVVPVTLDHPHLWDGLKDPYLYQVETKLTGDAGGDFVIETTGLRAFTLDAAHGARLNGRPIELRGVNLHQDFAGKGNALGPAEHAANLALLREIGANAVRLAHYPRAQAELDGLDRAGMLAWSEIPLVDLITPSAAFEQSTTTQLREMIAQARNHPSVVMWGLANEVKVDHRGLIARLNRLAHELDAARPTVAASDAPPQNSLVRITDAIAFNKYDGWYYRALADFGPDIDAALAALPDRPVGVSEYGAGANPLHHQEPPEQPKIDAPIHPEEWQSRLHEVYLDAFAARPRLFGHFVWNLCDFAAPIRHEGGLPGLNTKGLVSYDRSVRKDAFYLYRAAWSAEPTVYITSRRARARDHSPIPVRVYSNLPALELRVNGSAAQGPPARLSHGFLWPAVPLKPGRNHLVVTGVFPATGQVIKDEVDLELGAAAP